MTEQLTTLIERRQKEFGPDLGSTSELLAAACVGAARQVCEHALDHDGDLKAAQHLAARLVENAFRLLDSDTQR